VIVTYRVQYSRVGGLGVKLGRFGVRDMKVEVVVVPFFVAYNRAYIVRSVIGGSFFNARFPS